MKLLLDTHILLWWLDNAPTLSKQAKSLIGSPENFVFISAASIWEIRIKEALGKISVPKDFEQVIEEEPFEKLSITVRHAHSIRTLPPYHRDPFDRILLAQASLDDLVLVTHDEIFKKYNVPCELV